MDVKSSIKNETPVYRKVVFIENKELKEWKKHFSVFGSKKEFARATGILSDTLKRVLDKGQGERRVVNAIRSFIESQNHTA